MLSLSKMSPPMPPKTRTEGLMEKVQRTRADSVEELDRLLGRAPRRPDLLPAGTDETDFKAALRRRLPKK